MSDDIIREYLRSDPRAWLSMILKILLIEYPFPPSPKKIGLEMSLVVSTDSDFITILANELYLCCEEGYCVETKVLLWPSGPSRNSVTKFADSEGTISLQDAQVESLDVDFNSL